MENRRTVNKKVIKLGTLLNEKQRQQLSDCYHKEDAKVAILEINGNKAPGPDGFSS